MAKKKKSKRAKPKSTVAASVGGQEEEEEEDAENSNITTVKTGLKNILRPKFRQILSKAIAEKSVEATKICALASLLFLNKVQRAFDDNHYAFFNENKGEKVINGCFLGVLPKKVKEMPNEFRNMVREFNVELPDNSYFGNAIKDLVKTYVTNVKNNLSQHAKKRLREYLRMKVYQRNRMIPLIVKYNEEDINHTIAWAIFGKNSIKKEDPERVVKETRRTILLDMIIENSWWPIPYKNIYRFTKMNWFKSIAFWISIQRQIDEFNSDEECREQRMWERAHFRICQRQKSTGHCKCGATKSCPPRVRNLAVIPICKFTRAHYTLDHFTLFQLLCGIRLIPRTDGKRRMRNITFNEFMDEKEWVWSLFFEMRKINWFVRKKKKFRFRILSDGISASIQYDVDKEQAEPIEKQKERVVHKYENGGFANESGTDPGENTWNATTVRCIETGKEVNSLKFYSFLIVHLFKKQNFICIFEFSYNKLSF